MAISIVPISVGITISQRPRPNTPTLDRNAANFTGTNISATGRVSLDGAAGDDPTQWTVGFLPAQWIETDCGYYQGDQNSDGSLLVQRARPPARPAQACRDTVGPVNDIFYCKDPSTGEILTPAAGGAFPIGISILHFDEPSDRWNLVETNTLTGRPNYLYEAQLEFSFCAVLTVRDPPGAFHHLAHFYWNINWQATFDRNGLTGAFTVVPDRAGSSANVGGPYLGPQGDARFSSVLTSAQSLSCNDFAAAEKLAVSQPDSPNRLQSRVWTSFDVRR
jgi:hypothetical protein